MNSREPALIQTLKTAKETGCPKKLRCFVETVYEEMFNDIYLAAAAFFPHEADDIVHDFFLKLLKRENVDCFPDKSEKHLHNYIIRITKNLCLDMCKKKSRLKTQNFDDMAEYCRQMKEEHDFGLNMDVTRKIRQLPERQQKAFVMYFLEGFQKPEIANILHTSSHGVVNLLFRAKKTFLSA